MQPTGSKPALYIWKQDATDFIPLLSRVLPADPSIVDAGAYLGYESRELAHLFPKGRIHSFEPVAQLYLQLEANMSDLPNVSTYRLALGDRREQRAMHLSTAPDWEPGKISLSSSLLPPKDHLLYSNTQFELSETVQVTTLDQWAGDHEIQKIDMLWLDMQGYELPTLKASPNILSTVSAILTEVEFVEAYQGQSLYDEVRSWLESQGFALVGGTFTFPKERNQWFGDALFVRKELVEKLF